MCKQLGAAEAIQKWGGAEIVYAEKSCPGYIFVVFRTAKFDTLFWRHVSITWGGYA